MEPVCSCHHREILYVLNALLFCFAPQRKKIMEMRRKAGYDTEEDNDSEEEIDGGTVKGSMFTYTEALEYEELLGIESYDVRNIAVCLMCCSVCNVTAVCLMSWQCISCHYSVFHIIAVCLTSLQCV